jgi:hypothetical protein
MFGCRTAVRRTHIGARPGPVVTPLPTAEHGRLVTHARHEGAIMTFIDEPACRAGARSGSGGANADAFTDMRWVTIRGDIARYPL